MTYRVEIDDTIEGPIRTLGRLGTPQIADHNDVGAWARLFAKTPLSVREREVFRHRMAHYVGCAWCANLRSSSLVANPETGGAQDAPREPGLPDEFYDNIFDSEWDGYTERERIIIELVERFAEDHEALRDDNAFWGRVHENFSEDEIVDVCYHMIGPQLGRALMAKVILGYSELCEPVYGLASESSATA